MLQKAGLRPFFNGAAPTVYRDVVFGACHTWLRLEIQRRLDLTPKNQWMANIVSAAIATVVSGPFNYARNMQYATPSREEAMSTWTALRQLMADTMQQATPSKQLKHLSSRLRIGWGTLRVALGMAFGHSVFDWLQQLTRENG